MGELSIEITRKCANHCLHCSSKSSNMCTEQIPKEIIFEIIDRAENIHMDVLNISGGEPMLHPDILDIIKYADKKNMRINVYTSGVCLDEYGKPCPIPEMFLQESGYVRFVFNLPAVDNDVYNQFTETRGHLKIVKESINNVTMSGNYAYASIHFVPTKINISQICKVLQFAESVGIREVKFLGLVLQGRACQNKDELMLDQYSMDRIKKILSLWSQSSDKINIGTPLQFDGCGRCNAGVGKLIVCYDGKVHGCDAYKGMECIHHNDHVYRPDSVYEKNIEDIFLGSEFLAEEERYAASIKNKAKNKSIVCPIQALQNGKP